MHESTCIMGKVEAVQICRRKTSKTKLTFSTIVLHKIIVIELIYFGLI